jgi:hypothetical protein
VELDKVHYAMALKRAVARVSAYRPCFKMQQFTITTGRQAYNLKTMALPYGKGLTRVFDSPIIQPQAVFNEFEYYRLRQPPYVDMSELLIDNIYYKEIGLLTGTQFDWEWDRDSATLLVTPIPTRTRPGVYEYNADAKNIEDLLVSDQDWAVDYTLAICKEELGRVRGKFQGVPGHELPITTDWQELLREGLDDQKRLDDELQAKARANWTPPLKG